MAAAKAYTPMQLWNGTPHLIERKYWESVPTPNGPRPILGQPYRLSRSPRRIEKGAPRLGDHTCPPQRLRALRKSLSQPTAIGRGPLAGIRVLDFTTAWAGPMCGRILAFLGAEVVKVESASRPDTWRMHGAVFNARRFPDGKAGERPWNRAALFNSQNHNKLGLSLDIKHPKGIAAMHRLAATADVVIANFTAAHAQPHGRRLRGAEEDQARHHRHGDAGLRQFGSAVEGRRQRRDHGDGGRHVRDDRLQGRAADDDRAGLSRIRWAATTAPRRS